MAAYSEKEGRSGCERLKQFAANKQELADAVKLWSKSSLRRPESSGLISSPQLQQLLIDSSSPVAIRLGRPQDDFRLIKYEEKHSLLSPPPAMLLRRKASASNGYFAS